MTFLRFITLLQLITALALGQLVYSDEAPGVPKQAEAVVRSLYTEVIARHPVGIPRDADMKAVAPYLSKNLLRRIDLALACEDDYHRQHQNPKEKPGIEWFEFGLFTGGNEKVSPTAFDVERTQSEKDEQVHWKGNTKEPVFVNRVITAANPYHRVFVKLTPAVPQETRKRYLSFDFGCLSRYGGCQNACDLLPTLDWSKEPSETE